MKYIFVFLCLVIFSSSAHADNKVHQIKTASGISAWLIEENSVPIISVKIMFRKSGESSVSARKSGLPEMTSRLLSEGTKKLTLQEFHNELDKKAIELSFSSGKDFMGASLATLSEHQNKAFELMAQAIINTRLDADSINRVRSQIIAEQQILSQQPEYLTSLLFNKKAFGAHPYSRADRGTEKTISAITKQDIANHINSKLRADNMLIAVVGDISPEELEELLEKNFVELTKRKNSESTNIKDINLKPSKKIIWQEQASPQTIVYFGWNGVKREHPDFYASYILNYMLGGSGLTSRLSKAIRSEGGLSYSVASGAVTNDYASIIKGRFATRTAEVNTAIKILNKTIAETAKNGFTADDLAKAKKYITGSFPVKLSSNSSLVQYLLSMQIDDLGTDYLQKRNAYFEAVTIADINRLAKTLLDKKNMITVAVGKKNGK